MILRRRIVTNPRMLFFGDLWPALLVLALNVLAAAVAEFTFIAGPAALWKAPVRYLRLALTLVLPLFLLPPLGPAVRGLFSRGGRELLASGEQDTAVSPLKSFVIRPIQGIGISLLLGAKLVAFLQGYAAVPAGTAAVLPPPQFAPGRFLASTAIAVAVSLVLSLLWTLDDLGLRHRNERTGEIKMAGKYLGVLLPVLFGFSGFFSLLQSDPWPIAAGHVFQIAVVLYPPFVTLAVCHAWYLRRYGERLLGRFSSARREAAGQSS